MPRARDSNATKGKDGIQATLSRTETQICPILAHFPLNPYTEANGNGYVAAIVAAFGTPNLVAWRSGTTRDGPMAHPSAIVTAASTRAVRGCGAAYLRALI